MVASETKISQMHVFDKGSSNLPQMQVKYSMSDHVLLFLHIVIIIQKNKKTQPYHYYYSSCFL